MRGRAGGKPLPLLSPYLPSRPWYPFSERRARRARKYFLFHLFSHFFFPFLHPAPLLPPPFPSSPLSLTLSAPQLSDTSVLQEVKCDISKHVCLYSRCCSDANFLITCWFLCCNLRLNNMPLFLGKNKF